MTQSRAPGNATPPARVVQLRCFLNFKRKPAGFVLLEGSFREEKADSVHFRFETAEFTRKTKTFGDMDSIYVRVTAGEEVLETKRSKDTSENKPCWKDEHLTFTCPKSLEKIRIEVMNENDLVGYADIIKHKLLEDDEESQWKEELIFKDKVCGTIWFNTRGNKANVVFKELKGDYKKNQPAPEKKEEEKKEEKKEEEKKEQEKKEEKKEEEKKEEEKKVEEQNNS